MKHTPNFFRYRRRVDRVNPAWSAPTRSILARLVDKSEKKSVIFPLYYTTPYYTLIFKLQVIQKMFTTFSQVTLSDY